MWNIRNIINFSMLKNDDILIFKIISKNIEMIMKKNFQILY